MLSGTLKFVPTGTTGGPDVTQAKPATVTVSLARHLALKWVALLMVALFMLPGNRTPRALWVLLPAALIFFLSDSLLGLAEQSVRGGQLQIFFPLRYFGFLLAAAWLTLKGRRLTAFLMTAASLAAATLAVYNAMPADYRSVAVANIFFSLILWLGLLFTVWQCRRRFSTGRFYGRFFVSLIAASLLTLLGFFAFIMVVERGMRDPNFLRTLVPLLGFALAFGVVFYVAALPFCVLSFVSPFYRARFVPLFNRTATPAEAVSLPEAEAIVTPSNQEGGQ